jgi:hypothetical protein
VEYTSALVSASAGYGRQLFGKGVSMYIGIGTVVLILVIIAIVLILRRRV